MTKERIQIPRSEYERRIKAVQKTMQEREIDLLLTHACGCESANVRYLTGFWAVFDFVGVLVPREGEPILLTGGPESFDFAVQFAEIDKVLVHPMYVETGAPEWDKPTDPWDYKRVLNELKRLGKIKRIGVANSNIVPAAIMDDLKAAAPDAEYIPADDVIMVNRWYKSDVEIELLKEANRITQDACQLALDMIEPGVREWEIQAAWMGEIYRQGAEGTGYPCWVTSGPATYQSLCKSTDRPIDNNTMVQLSLGAKYNGYCGNIGRAVVLGDLPEKHINMIKVAIECLNETIRLMGPGVAFAEVYDKFQARLNKNGFSGLNLYGPAHGTGLQECETPWMDNRTDLVMVPNMVFNIDIWIADDKYGVRYEDAVLITDKGVEQLTDWKREIIRK